jgi:Flp pilus assembly pilin Flp
MLKQFVRDESGFVVSAELVLIATLLVIGLIVGLSEVQHAVVCELNDVGEAIGRLNQSFFYTGFGAIKTCGFFGGRFKAFTAGSVFIDSSDECDWNECALGCLSPSGEANRNVCGAGATCAGLGLGTGSESATSTIPAPTCAAPTCAAPACDAVK